MNPDLKTLGLAVREHRRMLGLSQEELAEKSGLHRNYIGGVERGERNVSYLNLLKIAAGLELRLSELIRLIEETES